MIGNLISRALQLEAGDPLVRGDTRRVILPTGISSISSISTMYLDVPRTRQAGKQNKVRQPWVGI